MFVVSFRLVLCFHITSFQGDSAKNPVLDSGLVTGHAYTIVDAEKVKEQTPNPA